MAADIPVRECSGQPVTPGVVDDGLHCQHWYDGGPCCRCNNPADPSSCEEEHG